MGILATMNAILENFTSRMPLPLRFPNEAGELSSLIYAMGLVFLGMKVVQIAFGTLKFIWVYFLRPSKDLKRLGGSWAVVTGATDGIGRAYSHALAKKGLNVVLISRTQSRLDETAEELNRTYGVEVKTVAVDLSKINSEEALAPIAQVLNGLDVGVLINNAGMSYKHPEYLEEIESSVDVDLITINTIAPLLLTKLILKGMKSRRRGFIINIGSAHGLLPGAPLLCTYAGTKSFVNQFTRSLDNEVKPFGIRVQDQRPMFVATKMAKIRVPRLDAPSAKKWAQSAVRQIGYDTSRTPYWFHGIMMFFVEHIVPSSWILMYIHNLHLKLRKAFFRKQARLAKEQSESLSEEHKKSK